MLKKLYSDNNPQFIEYLLAALFVIFTLIWFGWSFVDSKILKKSFVHGSYFIMLSLVISWVSCYVYYFQRSEINWTDFWKQHAKAILLILALVAAVFLSVKPELRVYSDESNLAAISKSMAFDNSVYNSTMGTWYYQSYHSITDVIPKRPLILPTLTAVVHTLTGYRVENVFIVNGFALTGLLWFIYWITQKKLGFSAGICAMFLVLAQPVVSLTTTSGGFDMLSTYFALLTWLAFSRYFNNPSPIALTLLWLTFLVFINIRYESIVYGGVMALSLIVLKKLRWQDIKANVLLIGPSMLWLMPTIWQRWLSQDKYENPSDRGILSWQSFGEHLTGLVDSQFRFDFFLPYSPILTFAALITVAIWLGYFLFNGYSLKSLSNYPLQIILFICLIVNVVIFLAHHNGYYERPTSFRFFLILSIALAWLPVTLFYLASEQVKKAFLGLSFILFIGYHSAAIADKTTKTLTSGRSVEYINQVVDEQPNKNFLLITDKPGRHTIRNIGAINFSHARSRHRQYQRDLDYYLFDNIIVVQRVDQTTKKPVSADSLPDGYQLESYKGIKIRANQYLLVSKMIRSKDKKN